MTLFKKNDNPWFVAGVIVLVILIVLIVSVIGLLLSSVVLMLAWNVLAPYFGMGVMDFWNALGLTALLYLVGGIFSVHVSRE